MKIIRLAGVLLSAAVLIGQPPQPASVEGFVTSNAVSVLTGATVGADSLTRGIHRETATNTSGHYAIEEIEPGAYSLYAEMAGYGCIIFPHVVLMPGQHVRLDFDFVRNERKGACAPPDRKSKGK